MSGDYSAGWSGYRQHACLGKPSAFASDLPEWDGRPIPEKRLLVYADQGFGDTIQFARFLSRCRERSAARIVLCCQPELVGLFEGLAGVDGLLKYGTAIPKCDFQVPLASVPGLLGVTVDSVTPGTPYLRPSRGFRSELADLLGRSPAGTLRVGLVWQGNPQQTRDGVRSCPLEKLRPLLENEEASFYSLQTGEMGRRQIVALGLKNDWSM